MNSEDKKFLRSVVFWVVITLFAVGGISLAYRAIFMVPNAAIGVAEQTMRPDNIIYNYEWFHDTHGAYQSRLAQIRAHSDLVKTAPDSAEKSRREMELSAMRQTCRDLVTRYNANATKTNRSIFMGRDAPESLNLQACG